MDDSQLIETIYYAKKGGIPNHGKPALELEPDNLKFEAKQLKLCLWMSQ